MAEKLKPSLADKLKALGVKTGAADLQVKPKLPSVGNPIEKVLDGSFVPTRRGETFLYEHLYPETYRHGVAPLGWHAPLTNVAAWLQDPRLVELPVETLAFLDTETSGLAGGTGTYAFMVGVGRFVAGEDGKKDFKLAQYFMRDPSEEPGLLEGLADFLAPCQVLVTFNGKAFDAPLLRTRYTLHSIPCPFEAYGHLDMLPLARRLWRDRLPSRALKYLEENILMAPRTVDEVPGYEIPYLYFDYLRTGDATPLKGVFYHNAMDVVALAALTGHVASIIHDPFDGHVQHGLDFIALGKLFEDLGQGDLAARLYEHGLEVGLEEQDFGAAVQRISRLHRRRGDLETAARLWEQAAERGHIYAMIELAKYHEHQRRDYVAALEWTRRARELVDTLDIPRYVYNHWKQELEHREERVKKALEARAFKARDGDLRSNP